MRVKNTSSRAVDLKSGTMLAPGEFGDTEADDRALTAGLLTPATKPIPRGKPRPEPLVKEEGA